MSILLGLGVAGYGAYKAGQERKNMNKLLDRQEADNQAWYNANAMADYTQRADSQNLLRNLRNNLEKNNARQANMAVVTGATPEAQAAAKAQSNQIIADTYANLGAIGQQYKDSITNQYNARKDALYGQRMNILEGKAQSYENLKQNGIDYTKSMIDMAGKVATAGMA